MWTWRPPPVKVTTCPARSPLRLLMSQRGAVLTPYGSGRRRVGKSCSRIHQGRRRPPPPPAAAPLSDRWGHIFPPGHARRPPSGGLVSKRSPLLFWWPVLLLISPLLKPVSDCLVLWRPLLVLHHYCRRRREAALWWWGYGMSAFGSGILFYFLKVFFF